MAVPFSKYHLVQPAIDAFMALLEEDDAYLKKWTFDFGFDPEDPDDGLLLRSKKRGHDNKRVFHYRPWLVPALIEREVEVGRHKELLVASQLLWSACMDAFTPLAVGLDQQFPHVGLLQAAMRSSFSVLRLLLYDDVEGLVGKDHTDKCLLTFHVAESEPGLVLGGQLYRPRDGYMEVFGGDTIQRVTDGAVRALSHHVELAGKRDRKRWAVIFFNHADLSDDGALVQFPRR